MKYQSDVLTGELVLYFIRFVSYMAFKCPLWEMEQPGGLRRERGWGPSAGLEPLERPGSSKCGGLCNLQCVFLQLSMHK